MPKFTYYVEDKVVKVDPSFEGEDITPAEALDGSIIKWEFVVSSLMLGTELKSCGDGGT